jgi:hypothetical protein
MAEGKRRGDCYMKRLFIAIIAAASACLMAEDAGISIPVRISKDAEQTVFKLESVRKGSGSYFFYSIQRIKITGRDGSVRQVIDCKTVGAECFDEIGEYFENEAGSVRCQSDCRLGGKQDFLLIEDLNFDGFEDLAVRNGCGTGGCGWWIFLYSPRKNIYLYSEKFSTEAGLIRYMDIDKEKKLLGFFSGYQSDHSYRRFKVEGFDTLKEVYSRWMSEDASCIRFKETRFTQSGRKIDKSWTVKEPPDEGDMFWLPAP